MNHSDELPWCTNVSALLYKKHPLSATSDFLSGSTGLAKTMGQLAEDEHIYLTHQCHICLEMAPLERMQSRQLRAQDIICLRVAYLTLEYRWKGFVKTSLLFLTLKTYFLQNIKDSSRSHVFANKSVSGLDSNP